MRIVLIAVLLLAGCSSSVPGFILVPQVFWPQSNQLLNTQFAFSVTDTRPIPYSLRLREGIKVKQIEARNDLRAQLEQTLSQALTQQGARIDYNSSTQVVVKIAQLQALVEQRTLEHAVTNQVSLTIFVEHPQGTFSKTYSGDSSFTSPFKMDVAAVERELRVLTEQVMGQLLQDSSWHQAVRG
jgi:uncharacterized lipoprotein